MCWTPKGICDDYYSILYSQLYPNATIITNDMFRDHIYQLVKEVQGKSKEFQLMRESMMGWVDDHTVSYEIVNNKNTYRGWVWRLNPIQPISRCVQEHEGSYYFPLDKHNWWLKL